MNWEAPQDWWENGAGFFGRGYMRGDDSYEGYIPGRSESLEERTEREVNGIENLLKLEPYSSIVDCPTGYGRHAIELSCRWHEVVGVDINDEHLARGRAMAEKLPPRSHPKYPQFAPRSNPVHFIKHDMRTLCQGLYTPFDAVINMFYSFGFFADEEDNVKSMAEFQKALKDGGRFLMHSDVCPEMILKAKHYRTNETRHLRDGGLLIIEEHFNPETRRMSGCWTIRENGNETRLTPYSVRLYSMHELRTMARHVGFRDVEFFGDFEGRPFEPEMPELIMIATK